MKIKMLSEDEIMKMWKKEHPHYFEGEYVPPRSMSEFYSMLLLIADKVIEVETDYLFSDQFNTAAIKGVSESGMRIMEIYVAKVIDDERLFRHCR